MNVIKRKTKIDYGVVEYSEEKSVLAVKEKPEYEHVIMSGVYVLNKSVFDSIPVGQPQDMNELIDILIRSGSKVLCHAVNDNWYDIGQFKEYRNLSSQINQA